ncbi:hypothetical protein QAD02_016489 [Eretmocerus hayati]|uniref:Uncharacterized protein n=1 Tax=Eretmocerus hayati TaxID=131215 RepID=A0ACC2PB85_9HYME|nr:hypothetical protein QAD02_016489 [Eretmocerus hayati]
MVISNLSSSLEAGGGGGPRIMRRSSIWTHEAPINWELNERISLSSAGSLRVEPSSITRSALQRTFGRSTKKIITNDKENIDYSKGNDDDERPAKPIEPKIQIKITNPQLQSNGTPVQRRWLETSEKLDRTNGALAKRQSLIDELNRKIVASQGKPSLANNSTSSKRKNRGWRPSLGCASTGTVSTVATKTVNCCSGNSTQEDSALRELNEAIDRFEELENEDLDLDYEDDEADDSFKKLDSSWDDSGVGADELIKSINGSGSGVGKVDKGSGWLRIDTGIDESLVYLTLETSAADVCRDLLLSDQLALYAKVRRYILLFLHLAGYDLSWKGGTARVEGWDILFFIQWQISKSSFIAEKLLTE